MEQFAPPASPFTTAAFNQAAYASQVWRGQCLDAFCTVERHVSLALVSVRAELAYRKVKLTPPHLFGQKLENLRLLCQSEGRLKQRPTLLEALDSFCEYLELRAHVCHGALTITIGADGEPYYLFSLTHLTKKTSHESTLAISKTAAKRVRQSLAIAASNLTNELDAVTAPDQAGQSPPVPVSIPC